MLRKVLAAGCLTLGCWSTATGQYQPAAAPAGNNPYGSQQAGPQQAPSQPVPQRQYGPPQQQPQIRRVAGEAPVSGNSNFNTQPAGQPGNVITNPPGSVGPGGNVQPLGQPNNPNGQTGPAGPPQQGAPLPPPRPTVPQLSPQQQKFVDDLLAQWEVSSGKIVRFSCEFNRWEYDPNFGPKATNPNAPAVPRTYSTGKIEYEAPDKGMFKVTMMKVWTPPANPGDDPFVKQADELLEDWRCDGKSVFKFDARNKQLVQTNLPPEMQGQAIAEGPLPFLFGAKKEKMKMRYWIIPTDRPDRPNEYWLEAIPKYRGDAANYQKVQIVLDKQTFLPNVMQLFPPNYDERNNPEYVTYQFTKQESNWNAALRALNPFAQEFFTPKLPSGWKLVVENPGSPAGPPPPGGQGQAQVPGGIIK